MVYNLNFIGVRLKLIHNWTICNECKLTFFFNNYYADKQCYGTFADYIFLSMLG